MESKGGKKKSSSSKSSLFYEAPLGYSIEDVRPNGGIKKFRSAAYSNVRSVHTPDFVHCSLCFISMIHDSNSVFTCSFYAVRSQAILSCANSYKPSNHLTWFI
ncbi:hypothetical protein LINPERPRIM_LOCUS23050 [Linum perenne]